MVQSVFKLMATVYARCGINQLEQEGHTFHYLRSLRNQILKSLVSMKHLSITFQGKQETLSFWFVLSVRAKCTNCPWRFTIRI